MPAIALRTISSRISIESLTSPDEETHAWLQAVSSRIKLRTVQRDLFSAALMDGEAFVIAAIASGQETGVTIHQRFTAAEIGGTNSGCRAHFENDDPNQRLDMVSKRWTETAYVKNKPVTSQQMTLYINSQEEMPPRVEKFALNKKGVWVERIEEGDGSWPLWLTENGRINGAPLPFPVFFFRSPNSAPITRRIWGLQSGMDQFWSNLLTGATVTAHQILVALGFFPTSDGKPLKDDKSNALVMAPRQRSEEHTSELQSH